MKVSLQRALISRLDSLHLEPGDFLVLEFPARVYLDPSLLLDAENFAQQIAQLTKREVIIMREGTSIYSSSRPQLSNLFKL